MARSKRSIKVLFCTSEAAPFAKTGGLADVCGALPVALEEKGINVAVVLPHYRCIDLKGKKVETINKDIVKTTIGENINVFFLKNDKLFDRDGLYGDREGDYKDNLDRFSYYCQKSIDLLKDINFNADIIHCHDWEAALIPVLLKTEYKKDPSCKNVKSILTIHNIAYQGLFPKDEFLRLGLSEDLLSDNGFVFYDKISFLKAGIIFGDMVTTVSPQYAEEIKGEEFGFGLNNVLCERKDVITGILNGIDYNEWDPNEDKLIDANYSRHNVEGKYINKRKLQEIADLPIDQNIPVFGFVGRLVDQKGLDLLLESMDDIASMNLQMVFLGVGGRQYEEALKEAVRKYSKRVTVFLEFDEQKAHQIYAGSDIFLIPSAYEPCGLSQMISLKYGTIPLVSKRGGLLDTIKPFDSSDGNGFVMTDYTKKALLETIKKAIKAYSDRNIFENLVKKAFTYDFSWNKSADKYKELYQRCLS